MSILVSPIFYIIIFLFVAVSIYFIFFNKKSFFEEDSYCKLDKYYFAVDITTEKLFNQIKTLIYPVGGKGMIHHNKDYYADTFQIYSLTDDYWIDIFKMNSFDFFSKHKDNYTNYLFSTDDVNSLLKKNIKKVCFIEYKSPG